MPGAHVPSAATVQTALERLQRRDLVGNLGHGEWAIEDIGKLLASDFRGH